MNAHQLGQIHLRSFKYWDGCWSTIGMKQILLKDIEGIWVQKKLNFMQGDLFLAPWEGCNGELVANLWPCFHVSQTCSDQCRIFFISGIQYATWNNCKNMPEQMKRILQMWLGGQKNQNWVFLKLNKNFIAQVPFCKGWGNWHMFNAKIVSQMCILTPSICRSRRKTCGWGVVMEIWNSKFLTTFRRLQSTCTWKFPTTTRLQHCWRALRYMCHLTKRSLPRTWQRLGFNRLRR